jgi:transposase-like protein
MKARNIPVTHVTIRQLAEEILLNINSQNMKARNIPVTHVTIRQLTEETLKVIN